MLEVAEEASESNTTHVPATAGGSMLDKTVRDGTRIDEQDERARSASRILPTWARKSP